MFLPVLRPFLRGPTCFQSSSSVFSRDQIHQVQLWRRSRKHERGATMLFLQDMSESSDSVPMDTSIVIYGSICSSAKLQSSQVPGLGIHICSGLEHEVDASHLPQRGYARFQRCPTLSNQEERSTCSGTCPWKAAMCKGVHPIFVLMSSVGKHEACF